MVTAWLSMWVTKNLEPKLQFATYHCSLGDKTSWGWNHRGSWVTPALPILTTVHSSMIIQNEEVPVLMLHEKVYTALANDSILMVSQQYQDPGWAGPRNEVPPLDCQLGTGSGTLNLCTRATLGSSVITWPHFLGSAPITSQPTAPLVLAPTFNSRTSPKALSTSPGRLQFLHQNLSFNWIQRLTSPQGCGRK